MSEEFVPLGYLLIEPRGETRGKKKLPPWRPGTLATAIEASGVYGWDRFMRFRKFEAKSPDAARALDALAAQAQHDPYDFNEQPPLDQDDGSGAFYSFGWPRDQLPDLEAIERGEPPAPEPPRPGTQKGESATLFIVGALLAFIKGDVPYSKHPEYESENKLIDVCWRRLKFDPLERIVPTEN